MFKRIVIQLVGPICSCQEQNLGWGIGCEENSSPYLEIFCKLCKTRIIVPPEKFVGTWHLEVPYPEVASAQSVEPKKKKESRGKVIPLFGDKNNSGT